jgi:unsaturated rhamnogalacturonyl hydrolase
MRRHSLLSIALFGGTLLLSGCVTMGMGGSAANAGSGREYFSNWPAGAAPEDVGHRVAENFLARTFDFERGVHPTIVYPEIVTWYGALNVAKLTGDSVLQRRLIRRFDPYKVPGAAHVSAQQHVDFSVFGAVPLEIFLQTHDSAYLALGKGFADRQWATPSSNGITREARYWVDDMYMVTVLQVEAFRATGDQRYLDRSATAMVAYLDSLQQSNGLLYHGPNTPFFWGRGNGWIVAGMAELLYSLPGDHPLRPRILVGYRKAMATLLRYQSPEGLWRQLIDKPDAWLETSGSGMFTFAMVTGVRQGWLDAETYGPPARKAWLALVGQLEPNGDMRNVSVGTNIGAAEVGKNLDAQYNFYLARERKVGDLHGEAPVLWTAMALLR